MSFRTLTEWDVHLPLVQYAINTTYNQAISMDPTTTMFRHQLNIPMDYSSFMARKTIDINQLTHFRDVIIHSTIIKNLSDYQFKMKNRFDEKKKLITFGPRDTVLVQVTPTPPKGQCQFNGPYTDDCITTVGSVVL